ncbi:hypothetical protein LCGC14_2131020 [marine sediment metagenome]|uniref:Uncharacterized protein n=1 Tax=marine sediment metagenome TaxID=412755 RepID=A0A0F9E1D7_9ZZZZ
MEITTNKTDWDYTDTTHFNGIPCRVIEEVHIILDRQGKTTREFVESKEFQMLEDAGIEVHSGAYS